MSRPTALQHTLVAALAASALAASPALARSVEHVDRLDSRTSSLAGTTSPRQDLRSEDAKDAARGAQPLYVQAVRPEPATEADRPAQASETGSDDNVWHLLGIGLAATGTAAGAAGIARHHRVRARRVAA